MASDLVVETDVALLVNAPHANLEPPDWNALASFRNVLDICGLFDVISFKHISRLLNVRADALY
ncbi:hypothetical protein TorRG33x02_046260 [Trema orientale]|uniref:RNase H type-1 domain-containing protein n=1 Tax=Trema orientale TaxID=63057 RepID=A0A2P5FNU6_TREOI|nr:hypothetical protein TorRG33x02_046260 [Trema orientale]